MAPLINKKMWSFVGRFSLVHVLTYVAAGILFMNLQNYADAFTELEGGEHFRSLDSPVVRAAPILQIIRGVIIALVLYPFYNIFIKNKTGWLKLFAVLWGLTFLGAVEPIPGSIEGFIYTDLTFKEHLIGVPEVTVQMLLFSWIFLKWERINANKEVRLIY